MASHTGHDHPATAAARAACRRTQVLETAAGDALEAAGLATARKAKTIDLFFEKVTVYTEEIVQKYTGEREIKVWDADDNYLGKVHSYRGSCDRRAGNLRVPGKMRTLWAPTYAGEGERTAYWAECKSISAAIRMLLR